jgi:hypothetical protein
MNFENHYLSHYRVIPLQSFGSHIRPQPRGLGLKVSAESGKKRKFPSICQLVKKKKYLTFEVIFPLWTFVRIKNIH